MQLTIDLTNPLQPPSDKMLQISHLEVTAADKDTYKEYFKMGAQGLISTIIFCVALIEAVVSYLILTLIKGGTPLCPTSR